MADQFSQLVDIPAILFSILWIIGFAMILSALSIQHYNAQLQNIPFREQLKKPSFQIVLWIGLTLVSIGFAGISNSRWEQIIWAILAASTLFQAVEPFRKLRESSV